MDKSEKNVLKSVYIMGEKLQSFITSAGIPICEKYTPDHIKQFNYSEKLGNPGEYPFTRGIHPNMYRGRMWTRRFQVGFGTPEDVRKRLKYLYKEGQTGFTLTIDLPTYYGFDSDDEIAAGEVGVTGVAISTLEDFETIFADYSPDEVSCSLSTRPPVSAVFLGMLDAMAEIRGINKNTILGTIQNDPIFQMSGGPLQTTTQFFPLEGIARLCVDTIEYASLHFPKLNWLVSNGYNARDTGITAVQEVAFSLALAVEIFETVLKRGLDIDQFAPRAAWLMAVGMNIFEEAAKFRAMRRMWAKIVKERFSAKKPKSMKLRVAIQNSGTSYTSQQPLNNIVRGTVGVIGAVLSGVQSFQVASYDEGLCLPTTESSRIALRTSQIIGYETDLTFTVDPLAGSYYIENLTDKMEQEIGGMLEKIEKMGGMLEAVQSGWVEKQIMEARLKKQKAIESGEKILVGVNSFTVDKEEEPEITLFRTENQQWENKRKAYLKNWRLKRNDEKCSESLSEITALMKTDENMIPAIANGLKKGLTIGEIHSAMRKAFPDFILKSRGDDSK
ncbi:MAG: methylmalonyl-CoA mutase family protein [Desulfobacterales bacterium]|nr:methylmalonyl-CoA mutase family protein [Desulfobacterales bacterium]